MSPVVGAATKAAAAERPATDWRDWLGVVAPHLGSPLGSSPGIDAWRRRLAGWMATGPAVIEIRLASETPPRLDFSTRLSHPAQAEVLAPRFEGTVPRSLLGGAWEKLGYPDPIPHLWLELDDHDNEVAHGNEVEVAGLDGSSAGPPHLPPPIVICELASRSDPSWLVSDWLPELDSAPDPGTAVHRALGRHLLRCIQQLPEGSRVLYAFDLGARGGAPLRLEIVGPGCGGLIDYLEKIADGPPPRRLHALVERLGPIGRPHLSFDVGPEGVGPRIGFELGFHRQPAREPGWRRLLDRLVSEGLCRPEEARALLAWPGTDHLRSAFDRWPRGATGHLVRCLSHLKLVFEPDREPTAKAYLLFENVVAGS